MEQFDRTTATEILAVLRKEQRKIEDKMSSLPKAVNMEVINKKEWNSLHRKQLHLEKIESFIYSVVLKRPM